MLSAKEPSGNLISTQVNSIPTARVELVKDLPTVFNEKFQFSSTGTFPRKASSSMNIFSAWESFNIFEKSIMFWFKPLCCSGVGIWGRERGREAFFMIWLSVPVWNGKKFLIAPFCLQNGRTVLCPAPGFSLPSTLYKPPAWHLSTKVSKEGGSFKSPSPAVLCNSTFFSLSPPPCGVIPWQGPGLGQS